MDKLYVHTSVYKFLAHALVIEWHGGTVGGTVASLALQEGPSSSSS